VVGERWTLLIIRELLLRPGRYHELLDGLPSIATNVLAERLSFLTVVGLVKPIDPRRGTAGRRVGELGRTLLEPIVGLARFGLLVRAGRPPPANATSRPAWARPATEAMIDTGQAPEIDEIYQFDVDGEVFHVAAAGGDAGVHVGPAQAPNLVTTSDAQTFLDIGTRRLDPIEALVGGAVRITGSAAPAFRLRLIGLSALDTPPASSMRMKSLR
jgi:DNA-binding HxlR family transcriptional regulator